MARRKHKADAPAPISGSGHENPHLPAPPHPKDWYWGDYNNKLPTLWDKRDLFNVLYGTMGMYLFNAKQWEADKDRFVRSYRVTSPVARKTGYSEMLDHRILSADRLVQRTTFADGTVVTVNFGETPFALPEGGTLAAGGYLVR